MFAVDDGNSHLVGIAGLAIPTSPKLCHRGYIWGVYVRPEARGHAIAAHLLAGIVADSRTRLEALTLGVGTYNVGAIKAYRAAGFVETGLEKRVMRVGDEYIDEITMLLDLR